MDYQMEELLPIVSELAQKYTGYESTSITYEKARSLMEAVLYCLNEYDISYTNSLVHKNAAVREKYETGVKLLTEKVNKIRKIFNEMTFHFEDYGMKCLSDTVQNGIPHFLTWYDIKFCPQDTIITLDYPVLTDCAQLTGADAVYRYILAIQTEQLFLRTFERDSVVSILEKYDSNYRYMAENICHIVLTDRIGRIAGRKTAGIKSVSEIENIVKHCIREAAGDFSPAQSPAVGVSASVPE